MLVESGINMGKGLGSFIKSDFVFNEVMIKFVKMFFVF